jgi:hypothetical protein
LTNSAGVTDVAATSLPPIEWNRSRHFVLREHEAWLVADDSLHVRRARARKPAEIGEATFAFRRKTDAIAAEAALDGFYVVRW